MTIYVKRNTDSGAPALGNTAGSFITLLDYLLVTTLGWTKPYTGTNKAAYKQPAGTKGFYLRVDDNSTTTVRLIGYETMSDVDTGANPFPTTAQVSGGLYFDKTQSGGTGAWRFFSNGRIFYLFANGYSIYTNGLAFGDIDAYMYGDAFATVLVGNNVITATSPNIPALTTSTTTTSTGHFIARAYSQIGTSQNFGKVTDRIRSGNGSIAGNAGVPYPSPILGGLLLAPAWATDPSASDVRGVFPGLWVPMHALPFTDGQLVTNVQTLPGRTFETVTVGGSTSGQFLLETSDTWGGF